jgi:hypothetical protein
VSVECFEYTLNMIVKPNTKYQTPNITTDALELQVQLKSDSQVSDIHCLVPTPPPGKVRRMEGRHGEEEGRQVRDLYATERSDHVCYGACR